MLTPAGPDHAQIASVSGILDYFDLVYQHHFSQERSQVEKSILLNKLFQEHEKILMEPLLEFLRSRKDVQILGTDTVEHRAPIISIRPRTKNIKRVYAGLVKHKLMLGMGNFYAHRPLIDMGIPVDPGVIRISFLHYTCMPEIDQLISGLDMTLNS